jgi:hypothetical protein
MDHPQTTGPAPTREPTPVPGPDLGPGPSPGPSPGPGLGERCSSVVGRWRCARPRAHSGLHAAQDAGGRTTWNDNASGRRLREL